MNSTYWTVPGEGVTAGELALHLRGKLVVTDWDAGINRRTALAIHKDLFIEPTIYDAVRAVEALKQVGVQAEPQP